MRGELAMALAIAGGALMGLGDQRRHAEHCQPRPTAAALSVDPHLRTQYLAEGTGESGFRVISGSDGPEPDEAVRSNEDGAIAIDLTLA